MNMWARKLSKRTSLINPVNIYTNSYSASSNVISNIIRMVFAWKDSIYKLIWQDVLIFLAGYALFSLFYRLVFFNYPPARETFELVCIFANRISGVIPITYITGFYVSHVVERWWDQFMSLPWPEQVAYKLVAFIPGKSPFKKNLRGTIMRYINLSTVLVYRLVSTKVKDRYPNYEALVDDKLLLPHEVPRLARAEKSIPFESSCIPIVWAIKLVQRARSEDRIEMAASIYNAMITSLDYIQDCNRKLLNYGWMNFPLAYTQVATSAVMLFFIAAVFGRQYLIPREEALNRHMFPHLNITYSTAPPFNVNTPDFYVPMFTLVQLLCFMGWIKVADALLNSYGDDDQDFQVNYIIDRNFAVSYLIVSETEEEIDEIEDPFTEAGIGSKVGKKSARKTPVLDVIGKKQSIKLGHRIPPRRSRKENWFDIIRNRLQGNSGLPVVNP